MNVKDTLWKALINFPTIFYNALSVYDHWFCVCGNGYEWENGELIHPKYGDSDLEKLHNANTINEAILNHLNYHLVKEWNEGGLSKNFLHCFSDTDEAIAKYVRKENERVITYVKMVMDTENRMKDFSIPGDPVLGDKNKFKFYPLCQYSRICNLPDDITDDWLDAANKMYILMKEHIDLVEDSDGWMDKIGQRLDELNKQRKLF